MDLAIAKKELKEKNLSLVIVKSGKIIFTTSDYGVIGLVRAISTMGKELQGSSVADTVVGRAAAMLCRYVKVRAVYAVLMSEKGANSLKTAGIEFFCEKLVPDILNRNKDDICQFEKLVAGCISEKECYERIKAAVRK